MKKTYLIIAGSIILVLLLAVWGYLFFFGTPESMDDVFSDFGFTPADEPIDTTELPVAEPTVDVTDENDTDPSRLTQLTTREVAGYYSNQEMVRYVELGTGHIYEIDLSNGEEKQISKTTIPQAHSAHFSPDGTLVVLQSRYHAEEETILGRISSTSPSLETTSLSSLIGGVIENVTINSSGELLYTQKTNTGLRGSSLNLYNLNQRVLFSAPFQSAMVHWGEDDRHYLQTKPASNLTGYVYEAAGTLSPLPLIGEGLLLARVGDTIMYSLVEDDQYHTYTLNNNMRDSLPLPFIALPEKCDTDAAIAGLIICAGTINVGESISYLDDWYKGEIRHNDDILFYNVTEGSAGSLLSLEKESGREIDVINLTFDGTSSRIFFTNKLDNTLWSYAN